MLLILFFCKSPQFLLRRDVTQFSAYLSLSIRSFVLQILRAYDSASARQTALLLQREVGDCWPLQWIIDSLRIPETPCKRFLYPGFTFGKILPLIFLVASLGLVIALLLRKGWGMRRSENRGRRGGGISEPGWVRRGGETDRQSSSSWSRTRAANIISNGTTGAESGAWKCSVVESLWGRFMLKRGRGVHLRAGEQHRSYSKVGCYILR